MWNLRRRCAIVPQPSELRFGVVRAVGRGIAVLRGGPRRARRRGGFGGFLFSIFIMGMPLGRRRWNVSYSYAKTWQRFRSANVSLKSSIRGPFRPPDIVVGERILYQAFFSRLYFRPLISELAERNSTIYGDMVESKSSLKMHVQNLGYALPYKSGVQNHRFGRLRNSTANLTAYIFGTKHGIHKGASALQTTRGLLHRLKTT